MFTNIFGYFCGYQLKTSYKIRKTRKGSTILNQGEKMMMTARQHALLFALISKLLIREIGIEKGEPMIRKAVREYGRQRGKRMALRAKENGHSLTMDNYFAYGEWAVTKNEMKFKFIEKTPHARMNIFQCPWYETWKDSRLLEFGKYFCQEIDAALVHGFNPQLVIHVNSTRTNGGEYCDFIFRDAGLSLFKSFHLIFKKKVRPGRNAVMPWEYHCGHLYKTMGDVIHKELGQRTDMILNDVVKEAAPFFREDQISRIVSYKDTDFEILP